MPALPRPRRRTATAAVIGMAVLGTALAVPAQAVEVDQVSAALRLEQHLLDRLVAESSAVRKAGSGATTVRTFPSDAASPTTTPAAATATAAPVAAPRPPALLGTKAITARTSPRTIRALQQRLTWAGLPTKVTGSYDAATTAQVSLWQAKRGLPTTGRADVVTIGSLAKATRSNGALDPRCASSGVVLCVNKTQKVLRYVKDGRVVRQFQVNVGPERGQKEYGRYSSTRVGVFAIERKETLHVSSQYGTRMPYAMFFDQGIAFHTSTWFGQTGYANSSYGCVTSGKTSESAWLFRNSPVGTRVVVSA